MLRPNPLPECFASAVCQFVLLVACLASMLCQNALTICFTCRCALLASVLCLPVCFAKALCNMFASMILQVCLASVLCQYVLPFLFASFLLASLLANLLVGVLVDLLTSMPCQHALLMRIFATKCASLAKSILPVCLQTVFAKPSRWRVCPYVGDWPCALFGDLLVGMLCLPVCLPECVPV